MENILIKDPKKEILELCKYNSKEKLLFKELTRDMFKGNKQILDKYFKNEEGKDCFYANLLYFRNIEGIDLKGIKDVLKCDFKEDISLAGYKYKPEHYYFSTFQMQEEFEEDLFKSKTREEEEREKYEEYKYRQIEPLNFDLRDRLLKILYGAIQRRWIMILNLESVPGIINNALECHYLGVNCKPSNEAMLHKLNEIKTLLDDKCVVEWLKTNPTDLMFDTNDYISTYQRILRSLTNIKEELNYMEDIIHNNEDLFECEILKNEYIETVLFIENNEEEEEEE